MAQLRDSPYELGDDQLDPTIRRHLGLDAFPKQLTDREALPAQLAEPGVLDASKAMFNVRVSLGREFIAQQVGKTTLHHSGKPLQGPARED